MKRIEDIENLDLEALEAAALEESVAIPEGLKERIEATLAARTFAEPEPRPVRRRWVPYAAAAAAAALVLLLILPSRLSNPKDTFDDPRLAYAQVEKTFQLISDKMAPGVEKAAEARTIAEKPLNILEKINER